MFSQNNNYVNSMNQYWTSPKKQKQTQVDFHDVIRIFGNYSIIKSMGLFVYNWYNVMINPHVRQTFSRSKSTLQMLTHMSVKFASILLFTKQCEWWSGFLNEIIIEKVKKQIFVGVFVEFTLKWHNKFTCTHARVFVWGFLSDETPFMTS